ncbi:hypothetical protein ACFXDJ_06665 [Streptomyces sp. NPDC059443]
MTAAEHEQAREQERDDMVRLARTKTERVLTEHGVDPAEIALIIGGAE